MSFFEALLLMIAAGLGGALNAVAGGGSFIVFPALVFVGVPTLAASATSTVALWPGSVATVGAFRRELAASPQRAFSLVVVSVTGGVLGALLLLKTPPQKFDTLVPWLLLFATIVFAFGNYGRLWVERVTAGRTLFPPRARMVVLAGLQLPIAIYGGYFGAGIGILMLALLSALGEGDMHTQNALKGLLAACINGVATVTFVCSNAVYWRQALVMMLAASVAGFAAAHYSRSVRPQLVRHLVLIVATVMTAYFFLGRS